MDGSVEAYVTNSGSLQVGGDFSLEATDSKTIEADAGGFAIAASVGKRQGGSKKSNKSMGTLSVGASQAENSIGADSGYEVKAYITSTDVTVDGKATIEATSSATIDALAMGGALSADTDGNTGTVGTLAGAGAGTINDIQLDIEASLKSSSSIVTLNGGHVSITANDQSRIEADAGGVAVAVAFARKSSGTGSGGSGGSSSGFNGSGSVGAAVTNNTVANTVHAFVDSSYVDADGSLTIKASSDPAAEDMFEFEKTAVASSEITLEDHDLESGDPVVYRNPGATGDELGTLVDGETYYAIKIDDDTIQLAATEDDATDDSPVALTINTTNSGVDHVLEVRGAKIEGFAIGAAASASSSGGSGSGGSSSSGGLTGAFAGAGAVVENLVDNSVLAYVDGAVGANGDPGIVAGQGFELTAFDNSSVQADAGGFAIALSFAKKSGSSSSSGTSGSLSVGAGVASNEIGQNSGHEVRAYVQNTEVDVTGDVAILANSLATVETLAMAGSGSAISPSGGGSSGALAGAGVSASNVVSQDVEASIKASSIVEVTTGALEVSAIDSSTIEADAGAVAIAVRFAGAAADPQAGRAQACLVQLEPPWRKTRSRTQSMPLSTVLTSTSIRLSRFRRSRNKTRCPMRSTGTMRWPLASPARPTPAAAAGGLTGSLAGAGSSATNNIDNSIKAYVVGSTGSLLEARELADNSTVIDVPGIAAGTTLDVTASDDASVRADAGGYAVSLMRSAGSSGGSGGSGGSTGAGAIGASIADNLIGSGTGHEVKAYIDSSEVVVQGDTTIEALFSAPVDAQAIGAALAAQQSSGGGSGLAATLSGAGAGVENSVSVDVEASVKTGSILLVENGGDLTIEALDQSEINADAGGVAIAVAFSSSSGNSGSSGSDLSGSIGAAIAENTLNNSVLAYIDASDVQSDGFLDLSARSEATNPTDTDYRVDALAFGVAVYLRAEEASSGLSGSLTGAGSSATNNIDNTILAYVTGSDGSLIQTSGLLNNQASNEPGIKVGTTLDVTASDDASVRADAGGYAVSLSRSSGGSSGSSGSGSIGASIAENLIGSGTGHDVKAYVDASEVVVPDNTTIEALFTAPVDAQAIGAAASGEMHE